MRFGAVGAVNTMLDFGLLLALTSFGLPTVGANVVSSTTAFIFSFFANKRFTFQTSGTNIRREIVLFVLVTLFGLWVLQSVVIALSVPLLVSFQINNSIALIVGKLIATVVSLTWNYLLYSKVVFKK